MPRKTRSRTTSRSRMEVASMRPRPDAAENADVSLVLTLGFSLQ